MTTYMWSYLNYTVDSDLFSVSTRSDDNTGVVSLTRPVDYEVFTNYRVTLSVTNDENLSSNLCPSDSGRKEHGFILHVYNNMIGFEKGVTWSRKFTSLRAPK